MSLTDHVRSSLTRHLAEFRRDPHGSRYGGHDRADAAGGLQVKITLNSPSQLYHHHGIRGQHEATSLQEVQPIMVSTKPTLAAQVSPLHKPLLESATKRFWAWVSKDGPSGCWEWRGCKNPKGYGLFRQALPSSDLGRLVIAHRFAYELSHGAIPKGLTLDHLCRNRACVRPDHLEPVSLRENIQRGFRLRAVAQEPQERQERGKQCQLTARSAVRKWPHGYAGSVSGPVWSVSHLTKLTNGPRLGGRKPPALTPPKR